MATPWQRPTALLRARLASGELPAPIADRDRPATADDATLQALCATLQKKLKGKTPALVLDAIRTAQTAPFDDALAREREIFLKAVTGPTSAALRHLFFAERAAAKSGVDRSVPARTIQRVCVIGAGTMGRGIAMGLCQRGLWTWRCTTCPRMRSRPRGPRSSASYAKLARSGRLSEAEAEARRARITAAAKLEGQTAADLFVEAAFEDMGVKQQIFARIDAIAKPGAILATNTSYLDVNKIARATSRPADVVGLHFFSPAHIMKLLEIVQADDTADDVLQTAALLGRTLGKQGVTVGVCRGFVGNRMLQARNRAVPPASLRRRDARGDRRRLPRAWLGPWAPVRCRILPGSTSAGGCARPKAWSNPSATPSARPGAWGQKTGKGWYDYTDGTKTPSPEVDRIIAAIAAETGTPRREDHSARDPVADP